MRQATSRFWRYLAFGIGAVAVGSLAVPPGAVAQSAPDPPAVGNPIEPTGRAVCNLAFTLTSALGLTSFVVPPGAPLGPNEVIVALRPVLDACVGAFPPAPARQCVTTDLYPDTGLPITLPDPLGILTEQIEALTDVVGLLGLPLTGPLHDVFVSALDCRDLADPPEDDGLAPPAVDDSSVDPPVMPLGVPGSGPREGVALPALPDRTNAPAPAVRPSTSSPSTVPEPLRGAAVVAGAAFVATCSFAFRRALSPRRPTSLLDSTPQGRR